MASVKDMLATAQKILGYDVPRQTSLSGLGLVFHKAKGELLLLSIKWFCFPEKTQGMEHGCGSKFNNRRVSQVLVMFPLTRVPFWCHCFEPQPHV